MDLLKREMERKKNSLREAKKKAQVAAAVTHGGSGLRYVKSGDLRRHQEEQEEELLQSSLSKRRRLLENTLESSTNDSNVVEPTTLQSQEEAGINKRKTDRDLSGATTSSQTDGPVALQNFNSSIAPQQQSSSSSKSLSSLADVRQQLRALGLPVTLFGEQQSIERRVQRLQGAERALRENQLHRSEADEFRLGQGHGIRNPFLEKDRRTATTDQALLDAEAVAAAFSPHKSSSKDKKATGGEDGAKKTKQQHDKSGDDDDTDDDPHKRIYKHFKGLLQQWEADLNSRTDDIKRAVAGRNETKTHKQCRDYIRPLLKLCKRRQLEDQMLHKLSDMVRHCRDGEFVKAHDAYMDLAIGRSAWPIGVTQVGIHSRTGREKIGANNVAHVMNSELQRKYLTSVKRLLTYEQKKRTDVDPSKKVMN